MEDSGIDSGDHHGHISGKPCESLSSSSSAGSAGSRSPPPRAAASRQLQRKLDVRLSQSQRRIPQHPPEYSPANHGRLIPIQRLPVPQGKDQQPLVQWDTDDSEEDIVNFFPLSRKETRIHQELTDTFSIEEMSISGDDEEEEDLHLVPPQTNYRRFKCCPISMCTII
ncbi:unnamed protein product [Acanthoscelides obtectus]|uniref:Uncharacterized protein n=1 Tax=Acanthoscelides obtectus TaxID=200917 RepID=A0A9P0LLJ9_ACAOB|nr:unnamed protein product [Acanthoscelides obtectus]CAK1658819.1 hypothetical protein AOBTE_LOCUS21144 [Acanthoscelides obtectus]